MVFMGCIRVGCCGAAGLVCGSMFVDGICGGGGECKDEAVGEPVNTVVIEDGSNPMEGNAGIVRS